MSGEALTRYKLLDDVRGEVLGVMPRLVHDFCEGAEMVDADDATREIERLEAQVKEVERELLVKEGDNRSARSEQARLQGWVTSLDEQLKAAKDLVWQRDQLGARVRELENERDRLREQYNKVLGAIDEGLVEDDATLAAASITEMHATINRLRDENTDLQHRVTRYDAEMYELVRLRGLIGVIEKGLLEIASDCEEVSRNAVVEKGERRAWLAMKHKADALTTLLRERQEKEL